MEGLTLEEVYENPLVFDPLIPRPPDEGLLDDRRGPSRNLHGRHPDRSCPARARQTELGQGRIVGVNEQYDDFLDELADRTGDHPRMRKNETPAEELGPVSEALRRRSPRDNEIDIEFYDYARELIASRR